MWYDLLTLVILMYAMFRGAMKGIVWQLATIAALLMCFFFSGSLSAMVAPFIRVEPPLNQWIAMFILYLGFSFVSFGVARVLHEMIESMRVEALDRHLGAALGLVKGGMFSLFLTFFLVTLSHSARETIINSESGYVAAVVIDRLDPVIPGDLHALLEPYIRRLDAPEIEREHHDERFARDGRRGDSRDPLDRRDRADDQDDGDRDRPDANVADREGIDRERVDQNRVDPNRVYRDPAEGDRANRDRARRAQQTDRRDFDDRRPPDADPDGTLGPNRDRRRGGDDRQEIASDRDGDPRPAGYNRSDRRRDDDPFSPADADHAPRRRERRRSDERPGLTPASDSADDVGQPSAEESDWLSSLPALTDELKHLAIKAWRKTRPEHRRELTRRISGSVPDLIRKTLQEWADGPAAPAGDAEGERADLERDITRALIDVEADRPAAIDDVEASLKGIPDDIAIKVLRDWRADLLDKNSDPDPRTTDRSSLNDRILSQLSKSGVSLRSLDAATRERLRGSETR
jgi:uncharacterized membrane protein required for colicin V production